MSKLSEYLKLIPDGLKNLDKIGESIINQVKMDFGSLPEDELTEITRRRLICAACPFMSKNAVESGIYTTKREDEHCIHCGCPIKTRTAALSKQCGIENYNVRHPESPMELKWTAFKK